MNFRRDDHHSIFDEIADERTPEQQAAVDTGSRKNLSVENFYCYMAMPNSHIFIPTREIWPASSVNARVPPIPILMPDGKPALDKKGNPKSTPANVWIAKNRPVEQMTWAPGQPMLIENKIVASGGLVEHPGSDCFNLYRPPEIALGDINEAWPWVEHTRKVFPDDADHIINWLAHRVQRPEEKINHALVLGGMQGIGKDTILEPVKRAVGQWNFEEVSPQNMLGRFNGYVKSVILRISEARDLGEINRYQFYEHMKSLTAAPPDVHRVDEKHIREHSVINCTGVIITTNHKSDGIYLPADDRRHYVAWSERTMADFDDNYWNAIWRWYQHDGGFGHVAAYLHKVDLTSFDPKEPPPKTEAFWTIVNANQAPENAELADILDRLDNPPAITLARIQNEAIGTDFGQWLQDRRNRRAIPHRLENCQYVPVRNANAKDGLWKIGATRQMVYAKMTLVKRDQIAAAERLCRI